jgi:hypothetical protein
MFPVIRIFNNRFLYLNDFSDSGIAVSEDRNPNAAGEHLCFIDYWICASIC